MILTCKSPRPLLSAFSEKEKNMEVGGRWRDDTYHDQLDMPVTQMHMTFFQLWEKLAILLLVQHIVLTVLSVGPTH